MCAAGLTLLLLACGEPAAPETTVIVGATLIDGADKPSPHSVIVIREGRVIAVGPQQTVPIPAGSEKIAGYGKFVVSATKGTIVPGAPADILLLSANPLDDPKNYDKVERRMAAGKWIEK